MTKIVCDKVVVAPLLSLFGVGHFLCTRADCCSRHWQWRFDVLQSKPHKRFTKPVYNTQSVRDHNVIRVRRELSISLFHISFSCSWRGSKRKRRKLYRLLRQKHQKPDILCINKSLQSTISIYYLDRKYEPLCERAVLRVECYFVFTFCLTAFSAPVQSIVHWKYINEWELKIYNIWQTITIAWCGRFSTTFISIVHHCWGVCVSLMMRWWRC